MVYLAFPSPSPLFSRENHRPFQARAMETVLKDQIRTLRDELAAAEAEKEYALEVS